MRISIRLFSSLLIVAVCFLFSCKQKNLNVGAYDVNRDTIPPVLSVTVPPDLEHYLYGQDIHIVGTVTDLESQNAISIKSGKLKSLYFSIATIDAITDTVIKVIYVKTPNVDGKNGFTFNESTVVMSGAGTTTCRFIGVATDYADRKDSVVRKFFIN